MTFQVEKQTMKVDKQHKGKKKKGAKKYTAKGHKGKGLASEYLEDAIDNVSVLVRFLFIWNL